MRPLQLFRILLIGSHLGLIGFLMLWVIWLTPADGLPVALILLIVIPPLLLTLRGVLDGRMRPMAWTIFLSFPYFAHGVGEWVSSPDTALYGAIEVLLSTGLFLGAMMSIRYQARENKQAQQDSSEAS